MIKTFNINLAGQVFNINEDAYEQLSSYFNSLRTFYANESDKDEIIRDIEARFAELFLAKGKGYIITKDDATAVINTMGNPQDFEEENEKTNASSAQQSTYNSTTSIGKRLYKDSDNGLITGVCAGLSAYFGINDPIWLRIVFILLTLIGIGSPILIYIILSIVMPKAETAAQKLEMRGEQINLSNIEKKIKDETNNLTDFANSEGKNIFYRIINVVVKIAAVFIKIFIAFLRLIGVFVLSVLLFTTFVLIALFIAFTFMGIPTANRFFFDNSYDAWWVIIGGILLLSSIFISLAILLYKSISKNEKQSYRKLAFPLIAFFFLGLLFLNIGGNNIRKIVAEKKKINQTFPLNYAYRSDTIQLSMNPSISEEENYNNININGANDLIDLFSDYKDRFIPVQIEILPSINDSFIVVKEFSANGRTTKEAIQNATSFTQTISQVNNKLIIDPYLQLTDKNVKFRNQQLKIKVYVPEGKIIRWDARTEKYIDLDKVEINWDNIRNMTPPSPPTPPAVPVAAGAAAPPAAPNSKQDSKHKIEIKTDNGNSKNGTKLTISIDTDDKDVNAALDKAQQKIDEAREKLENAQNTIDDSLDNTWEDRMHYQHYIFKMVNSELVPID
ncbi:MAG TPA: PspC domain-containing protein [Chitinophagales bacterium]|jgi:phage shock protein PspC (stress-responsive transcriptional regulator)|nr:PspC domain-containing protein [Chitinophagales bacterium]